MHNSLADPLSIDSPLQSSDSQSQSQIRCVETATMASTVTSSTVCAPPSNSGPSATAKTAVAKAKEIARLKRWESEQAAELEKCVKFVETTCGCTLADGKPCSTLLPLQYYVEYRAQVFFLS